MSSPSRNDAIAPATGSDSSRRGFLTQATALSSGALFAGLRSESALGFQANDTLRVGLIGTGGRCRYLLRSLVEIPNVKVVAMSDLYDPHLDETAKQLGQPNLPRVKEFEKLLEDKNIDAVLIGAPDHWHVPMTVAACEAGKHVYVEKPLTHDLSEGKRVIEAQNRSKRVVQVGTQQRSMPHFQKAKELIQAGEIGDVYKIHLTWNRNQPRFRRTPLNIDPASVNWKRFLGNAPDQPFDEYKFRNWRWFWDFGAGILSDLMVHHIDIVHWIMNVDHPESATSLGDHFQAEGVWETPDTIHCLLKYPKFHVYFEGTFSNARNGEMLEFMGTEATAYMDRGRLEIIPERNKKVKPFEMILGTGPKGADFYDKPPGELLHLTNWVECIKTGKKPIAPAEAGVSAATASHLGNIAFRQKRVALWKDEQPKA